MIDDLDREKLGKILRKIRKDKGLRIEDCVIPRKLSQPTISNIEMGVRSVTLNKIKIYCDVLGFDLKDAPTLTGEEFKTTEAKESESNKVKLSVIEGLVRANETNKAQAKLKELNIKSNDPLKANVYFLQGLIYLLKQKTDDAIKSYNRAIQFIDKDPDNLNKTNIRANSYLELGAIAYRQNDFKLALKNARMAYHFFDSDGERQYLKHMILMNQAIYLEQLNRREQAQNIIKDLWKEVHEIEHLEVVLNMYDVQATISLKSEMYQEAIKDAKKGIELAALNYKHDRAGELWKTLGIVYKNMGIHDLAIEALETAKFMLGNYDKKHQLLVVDRELAEIYINHKQWRKAQRLLRNSLKNSDKKYSNMVRYIQALITLGKSCFYVEEYEEAEKLYDQAHTLAKEHDFQILEYKALLKLGELWEKVDHDKFTKHLNDLYQAAIQLDEGGEFDV